MACNVYSYVVSGVNTNCTMAVSVRVELQTERIHGLCNDVAYRGCKLIAVAIKTVIVAIKKYGRCLDKTLL